MAFKKEEIGIINIGDAEYPSLLREIPDAPERIYILGRLPSEERPRIAIVGTRKATSEGRRLAKNLAQKLSELGAVVVSGLAMGIDTAAHEGAVAAKKEAIAVLGNGLDSIYPRQNENLAKSILEFGGAIISEYPPGAPSLPKHFLERNRIVSGLCIAVVIIEAPEISGSLATARLAAEQGREVFIFPGPSNHPNYQGSHKLIRDGARLVSSVEDIIEDLNILNPKSEILNPKQIQNSKVQSIKDENHLLIFEAIEGAGQPLNIDKIIEATKLNPQIASQAVAMLTIEGIIKETERGYTI